MSAVVDLTERRTLARDGRWLTHAELVRQIEADEHAAIENAIRAVLAAPSEPPPVWLEPDEDTEPEPRYRRRPADSGCQHGGTVTFGAFVRGIAPAHCWACGLRWQIVKAPRRNRR